MTMIDMTEARGSVRCGVAIPNFRPGTNPEAMLAATLTAERLGWSVAMVTDHVLIDSARRGVDYRSIHESLSVLAWLAGQTHSIRLGTSVLVVPMRNAVVLAKELATIDVLSGGRLIAGLGIGWNRVEFENLGVGERFSQRGAYLEEAVALWRHMWSGGGPWQGRFHRFEEAFFAPLPTQGEALPIWIGGSAEAALRRAGRMADGYHASGADAESVRERVAIIGAAAAHAGRQMPAISCRLRVTFDRPRRAPMMLGGSSDDVTEQARAYRAAGAGLLVLDFGHTDAEAVTRDIERFDREVVPRL